jgi:hypothetical protein
MRQDAALYADMLDNPVTDEKQRRRAFVNVIKNGMSREDAELLFGPIPVDPVSVTI